MSATQKQINVLHCDAGGCSNTFQHLDGDRIEKARAAAAANGWTHRAEPGAGKRWMRQIDICPGCVDAEVF